MARFPVGRLLFFFVSFSLLWTALFYAHVAPAPPRYPSPYPLGPEWGAQYPVGYQAPSPPSWLPDQPRWVSSFLDKHIYYPRSFEWAEWALTGTGTFFQTLGSSALRQLAADFLLSR